MLPTQDPKDNLIDALNTLSDQFDALAHNCQKIADEADLVNSNIYTMLKAKDFELRCGAYLLRQNARNL